MPNQKPNLIVILGVILLLVVAGAAAVWWLLPSAEPLTPPDDSLFNNDGETPPGSASASGFNLKLFDRSAYQSLRHEIITNGSLPVQAPATVGKANPFL